MTDDYITEDVKRLIGCESPWIEAAHAVEASEVRRFHQATMDDAPRYWDRERASLGPYGAVVAPPAFPVHAFRRAPGTPDPLIDMDDADADGFNRELRPGLPPVAVPLTRLLNGGYEYEFFRYARIGERIFQRSCYKDIYQRNGASGPMVFIVVEDSYRTESGDLLLSATNTLILR